MIPQLEIKNVSKGFPIESGVLRRRLGIVQALRDVSCVIQGGETLAIVGGSGCGKSTLAKIIAGLLPADSGSVLWEGQALSLLNRQQRARRIQMVFQDPFASLNPKLSIGTQLREILVQIVPSEEVRPRAAALLNSVGLDAEALEHYPFQFSGGQRQRIAIARALALEPALLIADEPLSSLDVTVGAHVLSLLRGLKQHHRLTILFITHDLAIAESFADRVLVLQDGAIVEEGPVSEVLNHPAHPYTQALLQAVPHI